MSKNLVKSLSQLIDETLQEIETLKKGRFDPEMIDMADDKANGSMDTKTVNKAEDEKKDEEQDKKIDEKADKDHEHKVECEVKKADDEDDEDDDDEDEEFKKAEEAYKAACAKRDMKKAEKKKGINVEKMEDVKKSIDARVQPIEAKLEEITNLVKKLADSPVPARGATFRNVQPLAKSNDVEPLNKAQVLDKLVELKKSGSNVLSEDVIRAEMGGAEDVAEIANKYGLK